MSNKIIGVTVGTPINPRAVVDKSLASWAKQPEKPVYTAEEVDAEPEGTAESKVSTHNTSTDAHNDIRLLIEGLTTRLNTLANSDDTTLDQMAEVVSYIKSNRTLIESITTGKVSVADIVNNLTTNVSNKPLSAAQGVVLKRLIDAIVVPTLLSQLGEDATHRTVTDTEKKTWNNKSDFSGKFSDLTNKPTTLAGYGITDGATKTEVNNLSKEIADYLPKNQGAENVGMILAVGTDGNLTLVPMPEGGASGDVVGNLDDSNNLLLQGSIADGIYTLKWQREDGTIVDNAGSLTVSAIKTFAITKTVSNCTASGATEIRSNGSATVTITANNGYNLPDTITVSGASYTWNKANGQIVLSNPTSDVQITVTAKAPVQPVTENITLTAGIRIGSDGTDRTLAGYCATPHIDLSNIPKPCAINLSGAIWCYPESSTMSTVRTHVAGESGTLLNGATKESLSGNYIEVVSNHEFDNTGSDDVTITVKSNDVKSIRFSGYYGYVTSNISEVHATLTYTPNA